MVLKLNNYRKLLSWITDFIELLEIEDIVYSVVLL